MTDGVNEGEGENEEVETGTESQNTVAKSQAERLFLKSFIEKSMEDPSNESDFINLISGGTEVEVSRKMKQFSAGNTASQVDIDKISLFSVQSLMAETIISYDSKKRQLKELLFREYHFDSSSYSKIEKNVGKLSIGQLADLLNGGKEVRELFLKSVSKGKNIPNLRVAKDQLESLRLSEKDIVSLSDSDQNIYHHFLDKAGLYSGKAPNLSGGDIANLFDSNIYNAKQKKVFLDYFVPNISLKKAHELGIISDKEKEKFKKKLTTLAVKSFKSNVENKEQFETLINDYSNNLNDDDILYSTEKLKSEESLTKILSGIDSKNIANSLNNAIKTITKDRLTSFNDLKEFLGQNNKIKNIDNLKHGSMLVFEGQKGNKLFVEFIDDGSGKGVLQIGKRGIGKYNESSTENITLSYEDFIEFCSNGGEELGGVDYINIYKKGDFLYKIANKEYDSVGRLGLMTKEEIENMHLPEKLRKNADLRLKKEKEIRNSDEYKNEKSRLQKEESNLLKEKSDGEQTTTKGDWERKLDEWLQNRIDSDSQISEVQSEINGIQEYNTNLLQTEFDKVDIEGNQFGVKDGVTFTTGESTYFTITKLDGINAEVGLINGAGTPQIISYADFISGLRDEQYGGKIKRVSNSTTIDDVIEKSDKVFEKFHIKNGKITNKDDTNNIPHNLFLGEQGKGKKGALEIVKIEGNRIQVKFGDLVKTEKTQDGSKNIKYSISDEITTITYGVFEDWLKVNKLSDIESKESNKIQVEEEYGEDNRKGSFGSRLFQNWSLAEMMQGGKQIVEHVEAYLKDGNEEHAAQVAKSFSWFLPKEVRNKVLAREEAAGKKRMDEYLEQLKGIDSWLAVDMIMGWLLNKDGPEPQKEAAYIFMMEKYGLLYAKGKDDSTGKLNAKLSDQSGTFLWYKAFGGTPGDTFFKKIQKEAKDSNINFTEEELMFRYIVMQCGPDWASVGNVERRSRLHKDAQRSRNEGKDGEWETGKRDAGANRHQKDRVDYAKREAEGGTIYNGMGAYESILDKGGDLHDTNEFPFILAYGGHGYQVDQDKGDLFKGYFASHLALTARFFSSVTDLDILTGTIRELFSIMSDELGDPYMKKQSEELYSLMKIPCPPNERLKRVSNFYKKVNVKTGKTYGELITGALFMKQDGGTGEFDRMNKLIFLRKGESSNFKQYYDNTKVYVKGESDFTKPGLLSDAHAEQGISGFGMDKAVEVLEQTSGGGFKNKTEGTHGWNEFEKEMEGILIRNYKTEDDKKNILKLFLRELIGGLLNLHSGHTEYLKELSDPGTITGKGMNRWGIHLLQIKELGYNGPGVLLGEADEYINSIISYLLSGGPNPREGYVPRGLQKTQDDTNKGVSSVMNDYGDD